jgi:hypothetical protein
MATESQYFVGTRANIYTHELKDGDDPVAIAKRLTMSIWRSNN